VAGKAEEESVLVARATTTTRPGADPGDAQQPGGLNQARSVFDVPEPELAKIKGGSASAEELAALAVIFISKLRPPPEPHAPTASVLPTGWGSHWKAIRAVQIPGPGAYRDSYR